MRAFAPLTLLIVLAVAVLAGCSSSSYGGSGSHSSSTLPASPTVASNPPLPTTTLTCPGGSLTVELATTADERTRGLSGRESMPRDAGMLFDLGTTQNTSFWMKDMRFALDMVWVTEDKRIAGVTEDVQPQPGTPDNQLRLYPPPVPVRYVLELNAGVAAERGLAAGTQLGFTIP